MQHLSKTVSQWGKQQVSNLQQLEKDAGVFCGWNGCQWMPLLLSVQAQKLCSSTRDFFFLSKLIAVVIKMITGKRQLLILRGVCLSLRDSGRSSSVDSRGTLSLIRDICVRYFVTFILSAGEKNREI